MILTLLTLFAILIGVICIVIYNKRGYDNDGWEKAGAVLTIIGGICLIACLVMIITKEMRAGDEIVQIEAIRETFQSARADKSIYPIENAAIQLKVAGKNEWIAYAKYWANHPLTNWFWSKRILEIKPIK